MRRILIGTGIFLLVVGAVAVGGMLMVDRSGYHYVDPDLSLGPNAGDRLKLETRFTKPPEAKVYIVIDRTHNRLELRKGTTTTLSAVCSAGSVRTT